jgi:hypothetical protein
MRQFVEKSDFDEDLFQPRVIIADRDTLTSKVSEVAIVNLVSHE